MDKEELKKYTLDEITDEFIGKQGTPWREKFEFDLKLDLRSESLRKGILKNE